jgi:hypothetical protein
MMQQRKNACSQLRKINDCFFSRNLVHPRTKFDVGYRLSRSGLAVAYDQENITYQGPIIVDISVGAGSHQVNVTYSSAVSPSVELRNPNGFEICCLGKEMCTPKGNKLVGGSS